MLRILAFSIKLANFCKLVPFEWDGRRQLMRMSTSMFHLHCWTCQVYLSFVHLLFVSGRLWQSVSAQQESFTFYCVQFNYYLAFVLVLIYQISILACRTEWILFINRLILFSKKINGK